MLQKLLSAMDTMSKASDLTKQTNILDAIYFIVHSIKQIKTETITKCGFVWDELVATVEDDPIPTAELQNMIEAIYGDHNNSALDFLAIDDGVVFENDEILKELMTSSASTSARSEGTGNNSDSAESSDEADILIPDKTR